MLNLLTNAAQAMEKFGLEQALLWRAQPEQEVAGRAEVPREERERPSA
ncbi:hypothetical protein [Pseudomonas sp.]|nr:hypothetical protein [Pseudomonas sp.]